MSTKTNDTLYLAAAGCVFIGTCVWAFMQQSYIAAFRVPVTPPASGSVYEPVAITLANLESKQWANSGGQTAGPDWLFDVFTPPSIYYNIDTKKFTVTPPVINKQVTEDPTVIVVPDLPKFGLELVKVTQPLFRLQLVGYVGEGAFARGTFENQLTNEVSFGTSGKKLPSINLEIVKFSAERRRVSVKGGTELVYTEATAMVRDLVTGVETQLDAKVRTPEGALEVLFKNEFDGTQVSAKAGDILIIADYTFEVHSLAINPPSVAVTKKGGDLTAPEKKTLLIPPPPAPAPPSTLPGREGTTAPDGLPISPGETSPSGIFPGF